MQARLPRELRDLVYTHLVSMVWGKHRSYYSSDFSCDCEKSHYGGDDFEGVRDDVARSKPACIKLKCDNLSNYSADVLGPETHRELAETWYSNDRGFYLNEWRVVGSFLQNDVWKAAISPKEHVRAIRTSIEAIDFEKPLDGKPESYRHEHVELLQDMLYGLRGLKKGSSFCLEITLYPHILAEPNANTINGLETIFAALKQVQGEGLNVLICPPYAGPRNALQLYCGPVMPVLEWLKRTRNLLDKKGGAWSDDMSGLTMTKQDRIWYDLMRSK